MMKKRKINHFPIFVILLCVMFFAWQQLSSPRKKFIHSMVPYAQAMQQEYGYFASIAIAQAALESNFGKAQLAKAPNYNLFGIKYDGVGQYVSFQTKEQNQHGKEYSTVAKFQKFENYQAAFEAYGKLFTKTDWLKKYYHDFIHAKTVEKSLKALTKTYATDGLYDTKLQAIIDEFNLNQYNLSQTR